MSQNIDNIGERGKSMELRQLATFIRVAQFKSFSRAAESLGYSQSAVTVQIRQLEEELDTRLFDRMGKRIALTDTGERFLSHACDVMNQVNQARMSVTSTAELRGSLHIGTIESLACLKLPTVLHLYRKFNPKVSIRITVGEPEELIEHMERGELDMIYVLDEPLYSNNWNKLMEQREEIVFVASASLREKLGGKELTIEELLTQPFFLTEQDNYRRVLNRHGGPFLHRRSSAAIPRCSFACLRLTAVYPFCRGTRSRTA